jgi:uncharacterized protein YggE
MTLLRIGLVAAAALAVAALSGIGRPDAAISAAGDATRSITVSGTGIADGEPNRADFTFGVVTEGRTARGALAANAAEARRVIAALRGADVAERDIQTQQVSISPVSSEDGRTVTGYQARNSVIARLRDLARAGAAIDAAVEAGANEVYGPNLIQSDRATIERQALQAAMADARAKAQAVASAGGVTLGRLMTVVEGGGGAPPMPYAGDARAAAESSTPIAPGTQEIQAFVTVTYSVS